MTTVKIKLHRRHLSMCLTKGVMKPFPKATSEPFPRRALANLFKEEDSVSCRSNTSTSALFCCLESKFSKIGMLYKSIAKLRECVVVRVQSAGGVQRSQSS